MKQLKRAVMWMGLVVIILLTVLSIYGAFINTEKAQAFFNSIPLAVYWIFFTLLLIVSFFLFPRLIRVPGLLLIHLGCVAILAGSLWGSDAGHELQKNLLGRVKMPSGDMFVYEGLSENRAIKDPHYLGYAADPNNNVVIYEFDNHGHPVILTDEDPRIFQLPFEIHLTDFHMDYYVPPRLMVDGADGKSWDLEPAEPKASFELGGGASLRILSVYRNFKIDMQTRTAYNDHGPGYNPAAEVLITYPDRVQQSSFYVVIKDYEQEACFILMFWAMAILGYKGLATYREQELLQTDLLALPETLPIGREDTRELSARIEAFPAEEREMLPPRALLTSVERFGATGNVQDVSTAARNVCESEGDRLESELSIIRYIAWAIPSVGFIGTVRGIGDALGQAHRAVEGDITGVTASLGTAFNSTFIALVISIVLFWVFMAFTAAYFIGQFVRAWIAGWLPL